MPTLFTPISRVWLLVLTVLGGFASFGLAAEFDGGTGEPVDPYLIATAEQLVSIGNDPNLLEKYYRLTSDIDLDPNLPGGQVFTTAVIASNGSPYSSRRAKFTGRLYGDGHTIRNLTVDSNDGQYLGLFGYIGSGARVYDLNLEAVTVRGFARMGALAGYNEGRLITCSAIGTITGGDEASWVGGLVGVNVGSLSDCYAEVEISGGDRSSVLGGLVGWHEGRIMKCRAAGALGAADGSYLLGGLVGRSLGGVIEDSNAQGPTGGENGVWGIGSLVGRLDSGSLMIRCYAVGSAGAGRDSYDIGGLVGQNWYSTMRCCFAMGIVGAGERSHTLGGLVGSCLGARIIACHADGPVRADAGCRLLGGLVADVQTASVIADCYTNARLLVDEKPYGHGGLVGRTAGPGAVRIVRCFWDTEASEATASAAGEGVTTAELRDRQTYQQAGWDLAGDRADGTTDIWYLPEEKWPATLTSFVESNDLPILEGSGSSYDPYLIATAEDLGAVVYYNRLGWFKLVADIDLAGIEWTAPPIAEFYGIFDGHGHRIANLTVRSDGIEPAGLFGRVAEGAWVFDLGLDDVSIEAADGAADVGGLAGSNAGTIVNCYVTGHISGGAEIRSVGGLVGSNRRGTIGDCYATATITGGAGGTQLGGLVGYNFLGTVVTSYAAGTVTAADSTRLGGLIGRNVDHATVLAGYYLAGSGFGSEDDAIGTPLTDEQMKLQASFVDWDFAKTWMICENQTYPRFLWEHLTCDSQ